MKDHRRAGMPSAYPAAIPRRLLTITIAWVGFALVLVLTPLLIVVCGATDLILRRKGWPTSRMVAFVFVALWIETTSHLRLIWSLVTQPLRRLDWTHENHRLEHWWVGRLARGAEKIVGVRLQVDIPDDLQPGPYLTFGQHVSIVDAISPAYLLGAQRGWFLRYTLTRGLRFGPCLDIVGHRIPNHFVARGTSDNTQELAALRTLVTDMEDDELGVIFPGGGLYTPMGLARAIEKLRELGSPEAEAAAAYRHVMPPRPGGVEAFFDGAPTAHVLVIGHVGFEPLASIKKLWSVLPLVDPVEVKVWRYDRAEVPPGESERLAWLYEKWAVMDDWIDARLRARAGEEPVPA